MYFADRRDAGIQLGQRLAALDLSLPVVFGVARGGVIVAAEVSLALVCPLDVIAPRKIPSPYNPEVAIGAVSEDGALLVDQVAIERYGIRQDYLDAMITEVTAEISRRSAAYRQGAPAQDSGGKTAILIDDGIATGYTLAVAARQLRAERPSRLVLGVPVASRAGLALVRPEVDDIVCLSVPELFYAVSQVYRDFAQVGDDAVKAALARHRSQGQDSSR